VEIRFPISGVVSNLNYRHWQRLAQGALDPEGCYLFLETQETGIKAAVAQKVIPGTAHHWRKEYWDAAWMPTLVFQSHVNMGEVIDLHRYTAIHTSRDGADILAEPLRDLEAAGKVGFDILLSESEQVWDDLWSRSNIEILGDDRADRALRYNLFQVLIAAPRHDDRVSIGAKTMSGYGYRGHVFWDTEIFILPFLIYTQPKIARNLLMYRYHTLDGAREKAAFNGYQGAMYAWESASTGKDVTPVWIPLQDGSLVRVWCGDLEQHISADIAYGIHQYWQVTGDDAFMVDYGVEMILSVAQFYASRLEWDEASNKYHIHNVIGPDEYHEHVDDNAMTNLMAGWVLRTANLVAQWLMNENTEKHADLMASLNLTMEDISHWQDRQQKIWINQLKTGEIEQFRGFFDLEIVDQQSLEPRKISLQEMFGIEGVQKYQLIKQPDVVMALYLLRDHFTTEVVKKNLDYYHQRTDLTYGSSLGPSIASLMLAMYGQVEEAYGLFIHTLMTDLDNNRGNTPDGIHAASAGAVWQVVVFGFLGLQQSGNRPEIRPQLPEHWEQVRFSVVIRDETTDFSTKSPAG
jgi:kojibiose phosphorylase